MNNKRIALALLLIFAMSMTMFSLPMVPVRQAEISSPDTFTPEQVEQIDNFYKEVSQPGFRPGIDAYLAEWQSTGVISDSVVSFAGRPSVLIYGAPWMDVESLRDMVDLAWVVDLKLFKVAQAKVSDAAALDLVIGLEGVTGIMADTYIEGTPEVDAAIPEEPAVDMTEFRDIVGATGTVASGYTGAGVTVGHIDTGGDFGNPDIQGAYSPYSFDPTSAGVVLTKALANTTAVSNITKWLEDGNVLTFVNGTGTYMNITLDFDVDVNYNGVNILSPQYYVYATGAKNKPNATDFFEQVVWKEYKIPDASFAYGDFHFGYVLQGKGTTAGGAPRIFTPVLLWNSTTNGQWQVAVDWEGAEGWNRFFMGAWRYQTLDFNITSNWSTIGALFDYDFTDDIAEEFYNASNPHLAHDYTGDGIDDYSIGSIGYVYDLIATDPYWEGELNGLPFTDDFVYQFRHDGMAFGLYYDSGTHGTATAAHVAADGTATYWDWNTNTTFQMIGIAPDAELISAKAITTGGNWGSYLWVCGFDYNETSDYFVYTGNHTADVVTNSWGWVTTPASQFDYLSFTWEILSQPDFIETGYPGVLHVFSAGNEGAGYMTIGPPGAATSILTVGASTSSAWLEYLYGPSSDTYYNGLASFTSRGPSYSGYPKPDVLAPGSAGYSAVPWWGVYWVPFWQPGSIYQNYTLFSGTSQAAPVAAGVAALVIEALGDATPYKVKAVIQATATDLGYDSAIQGFGLVNAEAACDFAETNAGLMGGTMDSFDNFAALVADAWEYWGTLDFYIGMQEFINSSAVAFPTGYMDGALFFGQVLPGEDVMIEYSVWDDYGTTLLDYTDDSLTGDAFYYVAGDTYTFEDTTFSYNDTEVNEFPDSQMYGYFNVREALGAATYDAAFGAYDYVTFVVAFNADDVAGDEPWMFLYDWVDADPHDGMPNLYNASKGTGDELRRLTSASDASNVNEMSYANTAGLDALVGNMTIVIHDPIHDVNMTAPGNDFTVTVIFWETATAPIAWADNGAASGYTANVTLSVPADADAGAYTGFVTVTDGGQSLMIPYGYMVVANLTGDEGDVHTIVDGWGADLSPYDNAAYGCMEEDPDDWDFRSYAIKNTNENATYLGIRVIWENTGNDMFVQVYDAALGTIGDGSAETDYTTAVLAEIDGEGMYYLEIHPLALNASVFGPVNFTIEVMWYEGLTDQPVILSASYNDRTDVDTVVDGDHLSGDHVVLNASYPEFNLPNMPEFEITDMRMSFLSGLLVTRTGDVAEPSSENWPLSLAVTDSYAVEVIDGIHAGDVVRLRLEMFNPAADPALLIYEYEDGAIVGTPIIIIDDGSSGDTVESGQFTSTADMSIACVIYSFYYAAAFPDTYELTLDSRVSIDEDAAAAQVTFDTYDFEKNGTFAVKIYGWTETNVDFELEYSNITFYNYFSPVLGPVDVSGEGASKTIEWTYSDLNADDTHVFEVLLSADEGVSYQLIATGLTDTEFVWDSNGFTEREYQVLVRVTDSYGLTDERESSPFDAGTVPDTGLTDTDTGGGGGGLFPPEMLLWIGLIGGIGVGVVVILILFLVKKK